MWILVKTKQNRERDRKQTIKTERRKKKKKDRLQSISCMCSEGKAIMEQSNSIETCIDCIKNILHSKNWNSIVHGWKVNLLKEEARQFCVWGAKGSFLAENHAKIFTLPTHETFPVKLCGMDAGKPGASDMNNHGSLLFILFLSVPITAFDQWQLGAAALTFRNQS